MYGKDAWIGLEAEGRLSDIQTLFIRKGELPVNWKEYPHIYFTIEYIRKSIFDGKWDDINKILDQSKNMITLETDMHTLEDIPVSLFNRVHIIYRIKVPKDHLSRLKKFDTISMDQDWYRCVQITKANCTSTSPDDYKFDSEIK